MLQLDLNIALIVRGEKNRMLLEQHILRAEDFQPRHSMLQLDLNIALIVRGEKDRMLLEQNIVRAACCKGSML